MKVKEEKNRIYWCKNCDVPLLSERCGICGNYGKDCASDMRPVFDEERAFLSNKLSKYIPYDIYYSNRRLMYKGNSYLSVTAKNGNISLWRDKTNKFDITADYPKRTFRKLLQANFHEINRLEKEAIGFIKETCYNYNGKSNTITVAFSGGKDSLVVADLVKKALPDKKIIIFFADTTLELPETYIYLRELQEKYGWKIVTTEPDVDFFDMCDKLEPPSRIMRWCCSLIKAASANKMLNGFKDNMLNFDGIRKKESKNRRNYPRIIQNPKIPRQTTARPIFEWSTLAVWIYILKEKLPFNEAYKKGFNRVGCGFCPYNSRYDDAILFNFHSGNGNTDIEWVKWAEKLSKFRQIIKDFAINNDKGDPEEFLINGYWKARKPKRESQNKVIVEQKDDSLIYKFIEGVPEYLPEFLKPISKIRYSTATPFFRSCVNNPGMISGNIGGGELIVTMEDYKDRSLVKKQIRRALNCMGCGMCTYSCPTNAISVFNGKIKIDQDSCINCMKCTKNECVGINYRSQRATILINKSTL